MKDAVDSVERDREKGEAGKVKAVSKKVEEGEDRRALLSPPRPSTVGLGHPQEPDNCVFYLKHVSQSTPDHSGLLRSQQMLVYCSEKEAVPGLCRSL